MGNIDLRLGDCLEVLKSVKNDSIDLTVTSPPYDNLRDYNGYSFDFEGVSSELFRVTKRGGVVVWIVNDATIKGSETGTSFRQALFMKSLGFNLHDTMIWAKATCAFPDSNRYYPVFEYMFVLSKGKPLKTNLISDRKNKHGGDKVHGTERRRDGITRPHCAVRNGIDRKIKEYGVRFNVWEIPNPGVKGTLHPATFPVALAEDHITSWTNAGDVVLDPFMGSGTTGLAAKNLGRKFLGVEISKQYFEISKARIFGFEPDDYDFGFGLEPDDYDFGLEPQRRH